MNLDEAIAAHVKWKLRLTRFIEGKTAEKLSSTTIAKDNLCDLGKWIHGEGAKLKAVPHYRDLVKKHANFHLCAAEVVKKAESGDKAAAKSALGGSFASASKETIEAVMKLKKEVAKL